MIKMGSYIFVYFIDGSVVVRSYAPHPLFASWLKKSCFNRLLPKTNGDVYITPKTIVHRLNSDVSAILIDHINKVNFHDNRLEGSRRSLLKLLNDPCYTHIGTLP